MRLTKHAHRGSSLIEVLVAVLILAVGLLGFSGIQTQAMRMNYETLKRAQTSAMAEDIIDRMRANRAQATTSEVYLRNFSDELPIVATECDTDICTPQEMARWELKNWMEQLQTIAPGSDAAISRPNPDDSNHIKVTLRLVESSGIQLTDLEDIAEDQLITFDYYSVL